MEVILCGGGDGRRDSCARYCYPREGRSYSRLSPSSGHGPGYTPGNSNDISPPPGPAADSGLPAIKQIVLFIDRL